LAQKFPPKIQGGLTGSFIIGEGWKTPETIAGRFNGPNFNFGHSLLQVLSKFFAKLIFSKGGHIHSSINLLFTRALFFQRFASVIVPFAQGNFLKDLVVVHFAFPQCGSLSVLPLFRPLASLNWRSSRLGEIFFQLCGSRITPLWSPVQLRPLFSTILARLFFPKTSFIFAHNFSGNLFPVTLPKERALYIFWGGFSGEMRLPQLPPKGFFGPFKQTGPQSKKRGPHFFLTKRVLQGDPFSLKRGPRKKNLGGLFSRIIRACNIACSSPPFPTLREGQYPLSPLYLGRRFHYIFPPRGSFFRPLFLRPLSAF